MNPKWIVISLLVLIASAFSLADRLPFIIPMGWPQPVFRFKKTKLTEEKWLLGKVLFYDPILSKDNTISCASCHSPYNAFAHTDHALSHGIHDSVGRRNAPALMNLAWGKQFMWDGSVKGLDEQAIVPITHPAEMGEQLDHVLEKLNASPMYRKLFLNAFGDQRISKERMMESITQFMLSLVSSNAKYDSVYRKEAVFSEQETRGYALFKIHCASCHTEPLFTNQSFKNNGLSVDERLRDFGLMTVTNKRSDSLLFKVPSLRNVQFSFPYMHDGRFTRLSEVVEHYVSGIRKSETLSTELLRPIVLSSNEKVDLIAFLLTLSDKTFVFNQRFGFPDILKNQSP